jgi:hypothetical protein
MAARYRASGRRRDGTSGRLITRCSSSAGRRRDEFESCCAGTGARTREITPPAVQVERVLDLVALGTGIGWLDSWQAARGRTD